MTKLYQAPMEGITATIWRNAIAAHFGGIDRYYTPFISPTPGTKLAPKALREVDPACNHLNGAPLVPQVMANDPERFLETARLLADLGYGEVNINLGCPSGTVTAKRKGAGMLADPAALQRFLEGVYAAPPLPVSLKVRLGLREPEEFAALLEVFNAYPVAELTVHSRVREEFYSGTPHWDWFDYARAHAKMPLCANGNLFTPTEIGQKAAEYPGVPLMLGRGLAADPALARKAKGGPAASRQELADFVGEIEQGCRARLGDRTALFPLKELWTYLAHSFENSAEPLHQLARAKTFTDYRIAAAAILNGCPLLAESDYHGHGPGTQAK